MIDFRIDGKSGVAPYQQIVQQVRQALRLGLLREGDQLPTVKEVVAQVAINPNTVLKAWPRAGPGGARSSPAAWPTDPWPRTGRCARGWWPGWPTPGGRAWTTTASTPCSRPPFGPGPGRA